MADERERRLIEQILELDSEELQIEEVDELVETSDDDPETLGETASDEFTFNTCLASLHSYLGEVDDTHHRQAFLDGGAILNLPMFYLEGVVLFPEATLPLRVIQPNFVSALEKALTQNDAPYTIGVVHVFRDSLYRPVKFATTGTTAEIRQYRRLEDGSINVVTRGKQRFHLRRRYVDVDGAPYGEVQIIQEDVPLRIPRDAFGNLGPMSNFRKQQMVSSDSSGRYDDVSNESEVDTEESFEDELSPGERRVHRSAIHSCYENDRMDKSTSSDDDSFITCSDGEIVSQLSGADFIGSSHREQEKHVQDGAFQTANQSRPPEALKLKSSRRGSDLSVCRTSPKAFWPFWVYRMYDSYLLAQKVADMWKRIVGVPSMDAFVRRPDLLSFHIASKIPISESTRQELLEVDGIPYRLRREIELLESFDCVRCKTCKAEIARRSDMLVMSSDGPLGAYVNPHGFVHEIMTLFEAKGLALGSRPVKEYSWFPGYAWTIVNCASCETQMGWLFTATKSKLKPRSFWAIRTSQLEDDTQGRAESRVRR